MGHQILWCSEPATAVDGLWLWLQDLSIGRWMTVVRDPPVIWMESFYFDKSWRRAGLGVRTRVVSLPAVRR